MNADPRRPAKGTLAYFVTEDWYFCSHRLPLAVAAREAGYDVHVVTRETAHGDVIRAAGLTLVPIDLIRRSMNPFVELRSIARLVGIYRRIRPDIVHHVAMKPVMYGSIAARIARIPAVVNALAGLGYLFSSDARGARLARPLVRAALRLLLNRGNSRLILQNPDDVREFCRAGIIREDRISLILGSGVIVDEYRALPEPEGEPVVLLASRMLWDKGVGEFVAAARALSAAGVRARFVLAGDPDHSNPNSVPEARLDEWNEEGCVEWIGRVDDMPSAFAKSHIVCLPSYREGIPKVLIEAAACGRPIVTSDAPGCREIVKDDVNGILVPVRDADRLASAIRRLLESADLRIRMGSAGRRRVEEQFALPIVLRDTLAVYESMRS